MKGVFSKIISFYRSKGLYISVTFIFLLSLIMRGLLFAYYLNKNPDFGMDSYNYMLRATNLLTYGIYEVTPPYPDVYWTPLYAVFLAAVYFLTNHSNMVVIIIQILLSSLTCVFVYILAIKYVPKYIAFAISLILAVDIPSIYYANIVMTETIFTFLLITFIITFTTFLEKNKIGYLILSGIIAGVGVLTRPILFYFVAVTLIIFLYYFKGQVRKIIMYFLIFSLSFVVVVGPWIYRNISLGYYGIAAVQDVNIYFHKARWIEDKLSNEFQGTNISFEENDPKRMERVIEIINERGMENTPYNRIKIYQELGRKVLLEHPYLLAQYQLIFTSQVFTSLGVNQVFQIIPHGVKGKQRVDMFCKYISPVYGCLLAIIYFAFVIGLFSKKTWNKSYGLFFVLILFLYMTALSGEWGGESRFRVPLMPLILIIASVGSETLCAFIKKIMQRVLYKRNRKTIV